MSNYIELVDGNFTTEHMVKAAFNNYPYVVISMSTKEAIFSQTKPVPYMYIESLEDSNTIIVDNTTWFGLHADQMEYSTTYGMTFESLTNVSSITLNSGERCYFRTMVGSLEKTVEALQQDETLKTTPIINTTKPFNIGGKMLSTLNIPTLTQSCMYGFFYGTKVVDASQLDIYDTQVQPTCFVGMFESCSLLKYPPKYLPEGNYAQSCYQRMFKNCSSLEESPIIKNTRLAGTVSDRRRSQSACREMFYGCSNLKKITSMYTISSDVSQSTQFYFCANWVNGVSSSGVFVTQNVETASSRTRGVNGIPSNWTLEAYVEQTS